MSIAVRALCLFLLAGCGLLPKRHKVEETVSPTEELNARADTYCDLEEAIADGFGFVGSQCDLVLFNALRSTGCADSRIDIAAAEDPVVAGEWHRDPAHACFAEHRTSSKFSRDMLLGLLYWVWDGGPARLPVLERFIAYAVAHDWLICEADDPGIQVARCQVRDNLKATVYELRFRLGGADDPARSGLQFWDPLASNFEAHVQALHLYLRGLMFGAVADDELAAFDSWASRNPGNALFAAMARKWRSGDLEELTAAALADVARFPESHLPDSSGRCEDYLWQREPSSPDWQPCPLTNEDGTPRPPTSYNGTDLVFLRAIVADQLPVGSPPLPLIGEDPRPHKYHRLGFFGEPL